MPCVRQTRPRNRTAANDAVAENLYEQQRKVLLLQSSETEDVTVVARVRPLLEREERAVREQSDTVALTKSHQTVQLKMDKAYYDYRDAERPQGGRVDKKTSRRKVFTFDEVICISKRTTSTVNDVFDSVGKPAVAEAARGVSAVIMAYGQTGSGKTYTLFGDALVSKEYTSVPQDYASARSLSGFNRGYSQGNLNSLTRRPPSRGKGTDKPGSLAVMVFRSLLQALEQRAVQESSQEHVKYEVDVTAVQVYMNRVYDLLAPGDDEKALRMCARMQEETLMKSGGELCELKPKPALVSCKDTKDFESVLQRVFASRKHNSTNMNDRSSRSHLVLTIAVRRAVRMRGDDPTCTQTPANDAQGVNSHDEQHATRQNDSSTQAQGAVAQQPDTGREYLSKLVLVDLAGNERDSAREGKENEAVLRAEGISINVSLAALGACLHERANDSLPSAHAGAKVQASDTAQKTVGVKGRESVPAEQDCSMQKNPARASAVPNKTRAAYAPYRTSALTRLLKEHLMRAKIFFLACCSPLGSSSTMTLETLRYADMVKLIKTNAEDDAVLLEQGIDKFPISLLPHRTLRKLGDIPRSDKKCTVFLHQLRVAVVRVMVSHRWLSPHEDPKKRHPDNQSKSKHELLCALFDKLGELGWIRNFDKVGVVEWIDFGECMCLLA